MVAEELFDYLKEGSLSPDIKNMDKIDSSVFEQYELVLICTSTTGKGEVPDNAKKLFEELKFNRPDLSSIRYGIVGFGSSQYSATFCRGPRSFDELMQGLNAKKIGVSCEHDAQSKSFPEEQALDWIESWMKLI